uniref:Glycosyltransferase N-terminal domain-containing protein n=1 Tax=Leersia perrieri TaxID=77586 RepID=A0A0D9X1M4_9ORYZ
MKSKDGILSSTLQAPAKAPTKKPHVLLLPYPAQGHVNPFLKLAKALHARSFHITFVNTEYNHARLLRSRGPRAVSGAAGFEFATIPDGLPPPSLDATQDICALCEATRRTGPGHVGDLIERIARAAADGEGDGDGVPPVSCVVADGAMGFPVHVAKEMGIPAYLFFTPSACGLLAYLNFDQLVKRGYVPFKV